MARKGKILVVDDDRFMREILKIVLVRAGYDLIFAEDGKKGVELAESERPDLVITDGLLPKMHGFLACKAIKELDSPPKVILYTGVYTKPNYKWEAKTQYGADDMLLKPANAAVLLACLAKHLPEFPPASQQPEAAHARASKPEDAESIQTIPEAVFASFLGAELPLEL
jgi:DNA-binding response OmpR family regulator